MRVILMLLPAVLLAQAPAPATKPMTDEDKVVYSLGLSIYRSLGQFDLSPAELELVKQALSDAAANKPAVDLDTWAPKINTLASARASLAFGRGREGGSGGGRGGGGAPGGAAKDNPWGRPGRFGRAGGREGGARVLPPAGRPEK